MVTLVRYFTAGLNHQLLLSTLTLQQSFELGSSFSHNIEQILGDGASIAKCEEPDASSERPWQTLTPQLSYLPRVSNVVPIRKDVLLPDSFVLLKSELLAEPLGSHPL